MKILNEKELKKQYMITQKQIEDLLRSIDDNYDIPYYFSEKIKDIYGSFLKIKNYIKNGEIKNVKK